jgi:ABC-2 type transport system ATP-binding protein
VISLVDVHFRYRACLPWAVEGVSFALEKGEVFGLLGPNGAGKTTLMALIAGLLVAGRGRIRRDAGVEARGGFALVPQEQAFYPMLSCRENLEFFAGVLGLHGALRRERVAAAIEAAGLAQVANRRGAECSGGLKRRLNLAIGLVGDPRLLLLDEPTAGVDPQSRAFLLDAVRALRARGKTVIYTSHYMEEVQAVCDRVAILDRGRLLCCGTLAELLADARGRLYVRVAGALPAGAREALRALGLLGWGNNGGLGNIGGAGGNGGAGNIGGAGGNSGAEGNSDAGGNSGAEGIGGAGDNSGAGENGGVSDIGGAGGAGGHAGAGDNGGAGGAGGNCCVGGHAGAGGHAGVGGHAGAGGIGGAGHNSGGGDMGGGGWLEFAVDAEDAVERVLGELRRRGARVVGVQLGHRHLEDVFLRLTHRLLRD